jgi:hypothetical protein
MPCAIQSDEYVVRERRAERAVEDVLVLRGMSSALTPENQGSCVRRGTSGLICTVMTAASSSTSIQAQGMRGCQSDATITVRERKRPTLQLNAAWAFLARLISFHLAPWQPSKGSPIISKANSRQPSVGSKHSDRTRVCMSPTGSSESANIPKAHSRQPSVE